MENLTLFILVTLFISCHCTLDKRVNYVFGAKRYDDELIHVGNISRIAKQRWFIFKDDTFAHYRFSQKNESNAKPISKILVDDYHLLLKGARHADVDIIRGGIGRTFVDLSFLSLKGYGFFYNIKIYGSHKGETNAGEIVETEEDVELKSDELKSKENAVNEDEKKLQNAEETQKVEVDANKTGDELQGIVNTVEPKVEDAHKEETQLEPKEGEEPYEHQNLEVVSQKESATVQDENGEHKTEPEHEVEAGEEESNKAHEPQVTGEQKIEAELQGDVEPNTELSPEPEQMPETEVEPKTEQAPETEVVPKTEQAIETEVESKTEQEPKTEVEPETEVEPKTEQAPETEQEPKREVEPNTEQEPKTEAEPETELEPKNEQEPQTELKPESEVEPKNEQEPQTELEPETEVEPKTEVEPNTEGEN